MHGGFVMVRTVYCKQERAWDSRNDAISFFNDRCRNSHGYERDRCIKILWKLTGGDDLCTDCSWYKVNKDGWRSFDNWDDAVKFADGRQIHEAY